MARKIITGQIIINPNPNQYIINPLKKTLILKNLETKEVEVIDLPLGKDSFSFIKDTTLNNGAFVKFADENIYDEVYVLDETERAIVLNKLKREATELKDI